MIKKIFSILLLIVLHQSVSAQLPRTDLRLIHYDYGSPWRFGFSLGLNVFDFSSTNAMKDVLIDGTMRKVRADVTTQRTGFDINAIIDYRIRPQWNLRTLPGISFGSRNLEFYDDNTNDLLHTMEMNSNYMELPIHLKFSATRHSNTRPYVFAGTNIRHNLSSSSNEKDGVFFGIGNTEVFGEFGFGFEFYLTYFKFSIEAKFSTGVGNVLTKGPTEGYESFYNVVDKLYSNMFMIKLHFE